MSANRHNQRVGDEIPDVTRADSTFEAVAVTTYGDRTMVVGDDLSDEVIVMDDPKWCIDLVKNR